MNNTESKKPQTLREVLREVNKEVDKLLDGALGEGFAGLIAKKIIKFGTWGAIYLMLFICTFAIPFIHFDEKEK